MNAIALIEAVRLGAGGLIVVSGLVLMLTGAIGVLRFPDFYTRLHAGTVETLGAALTIFGLAVAAPEFGLALRLAVLAGLVAALAPTLAQVIGHAAHAGGLVPIAGAYVAPRPGRARKDDER